MQSHLKPALPDPPSASVRATLRAIALRTGSLRDLDVLLAAREVWLAALPPDLSDGGQEVWRHFIHEPINGNAPKHIYVSQGWFDSYAPPVLTEALAVATAGISILAKSLSDRFLSSKDPCGDARKELAKRDQ